MPRPPILEQIDWKNVYRSGLSFGLWLRRAEIADHRKKMEELLKSLTLSPETEGLLAKLSRPVHVIAIAEDWCGDVVRHVPVLERMAKASKNVKTRYISREQHPQLFARFLTNGGEAIPKFVFVSAKWVECGNWGPMPSEHRLLIARGKAAGDVASARKRVSALYEADPNCETVVAELRELIEIAACSKV